MQGVNGRVRLRRALADQTPDALQIGAASRLIREENPGADEDNDLAPRTGRKSRNRPTATTKHPDACEHAAGAGNDGHGRVETPVTLPVSGVK